MKEHVTEEGLKNVMDSLLNGFMREAGQEHAETVKDIVEEYGDRLMNPEHFSLYVTYKNDMMERVLMKTVLAKQQLDRERTYTSAQLYALSNVYTDYKFYESQIRSIIEDYEGHACCADKSRYLMKAYMDYIITGQLPDFGERSDYRIPTLGSPKAWMNVLERCGHLQSGQFDHYKEARDVLIAELEAHVVERQERLQKLLTSHTYFIAKVEDEGTVLYHFIREEGEDYFHGQIVIYPKNGAGYIANTRRDGAKEGRLGYGDAKPDWFKALLDEV